MPPCTQHLYCARTTASSPGMGFATTAATQKTPRASRRSRLATAALVRTVQTVDTALSTHGLRRQTRRRLQARQPRCCPPYGCVPGEPGCVVGQGYRCHRRRPRQLGLLAAARCRLCRWSATAALRCRLGLWRATRRRLRCRLCRWPATAAAALPPAPRGCVPGGPAAWLGRAGSRRRCRPRHLGATRRHRRCRLCRWPATRRRLLCRLACGRLLATASAAASACGRHSPPPAAAGATWGYSPPPPLPPLPVVGYRRHRPCRPRLWAVCWSAGRTGASHRCRCRPSRSGHPDEFTAEVSPVEEATTAAIETAATGFSRWKLQSQATLRLSDLARQSQTPLRLSRCKHPGACDAQPCI